MFLPYYLRYLGLGAVLKAIEGKLRGVVHQIEIDRGDCRRPILIRVPSSDVAVYEQIFVQEEYAFEVSHAPRVIIDAGANIGLASIYFANRFPAAHIIALEPERANYDQLVRNVEQYPNVTPVHAALWHEEVELEVHDAGLGAWGFRTETSTEGGGVAIGSPSVVAKTIDGLIREFDVEHIDILKIDIEGAELEVFTDTSAWIAKVEAIIIELHDYLKAGCSSAFESGTAGFDKKWLRAENVYLSRGDFMRPAG
jgi:FkbM family methyltransferase